MIQAKCIEKFRDSSGKIIGYRLQDINGNITDIFPDNVKEMMRSKQLEVVNLTLTSDNRLVDKSERVIESIPRCHNKPERKIITDDIINKMMSDALSSGKQVTDIAAVGGRITIIKEDPTYKILIPNSITDVISKVEGGINLISTIRRLHGRIEIYGGGGVVSIAGLFEGTTFDYIDLSNFNTSNVKNMNKLFKGCKCNDINLSNLNTIRVESMIGMFNECKTLNLDLRAFSVPNLLSTRSMFRDCECKYINLSSFKHNKIEGMSDMFNGCKADVIDLYGLFTGNVRNMDRMFYKCHTNKLDLGSFDTTSVFTMSQMFSECVIRDIELSSFNTRGVICMAEMFYGTDTSIIDLTNFSWDSAGDINNMFTNCKARIIRLSSAEFVKKSYDFAVFRGCKSQIIINDEEYTAKQMEYYRLGRDITNIPSNNTISGMFKFFSRRK